MKPLDYRLVVPTGFSFAKVIPDAPQDYRVIAIQNGEVVAVTDIRDERFNVHDVQPLSESELLLVCCRSEYRGPDDFDKNARVYTFDGNFVRNFLLGDGIRCVQTTADGVIWTSYFDEGIFGNHGWSLPADETTGLVSWNGGGNQRDLPFGSPVGVSGLVAWNAGGTKTFEYQPTAGLDIICDCYAMNVESNRDTWVYYYTEFPLVRIHNCRVEGHWKIPVKGCDAFAVSGQHALFAGGYRTKDIFHLLSLESGGEAKIVERLRFQDQGKTLVGDRIAARAESIYVLDRCRLYRLKLEMVTG